MKIIIFFVVLSMHFSMTFAQNYGSFTDTRDGKTYKTIQIGNQTWMAENLAYLPSVVGRAVGSNSSPYYYIYDYNGTDINEAKSSENYKTYGVLYNWTAAMSACPTGWHLPSDAEWKQLIDFVDYLGGANFAANKLKESGTEHWLSPNTGATNSTGFTALPGGFRYSDNSFSDVGNRGYWWSKDEYDKDMAYYRHMNNNNGYINKYSNLKERGNSCRCIKD